MGALTNPVAKRLAMTLADKVVAIACEFPESTNEERADIVETVAAILLSEEPDIRSGESNA